MFGGRDVADAAKLKEQRSKLKRIANSQWLIAKGACGRVKFGTWAFELPLNFEH
jgi:hypothetical protein